MSLTPCHASYFAPGRLEEQDETNLFFQSSWCRNDEFCLPFCINPSSLPTPSQFQSISLVAILPNAICSVLNPAAIHSWTSSAACVTLEQLSSCLSGTSAVIFENVFYICTYISINFQRFSVGSLKGQCHKIVYPGFMILSHLAPYSHADAFQLVVSISRRYSHV